MICTCKIEDMQDATLEDDGSVVCCACGGVLPVARYKEVYEYLGSTLRWLACMIPSVDHVYFTEN